MVKPLTSNDIAAATPLGAGDLRFEIERDAALPRMAWALRHVAGEDVVRVLAGADVRKGDAVFWEGVNPCVDDPRAVADFHFPLCSGATLRGNDIIAFSPGHTLDRLFLVEQDDTIVISNSLAFALRASGAKLEPRDLTYHWHLGAIGAHAHEMPAQGGRLTAYVNTNVFIPRDHNVRWELRPKAPDFETYAEYRALLDAFLRDAAAAAKHPINLPYTPATTISTGYDSPAASVLARQIGAETAYTIVDSRAGPSDSGKDIADILGLNVVTASRTDYRAAGAAAERLFYFGAVGNDIIFYPWKDELTGKMLFSGYKGDILWDRNWPRPLGTWSHDADGATMQEFRLRSGFVHLPPAYFGWRRSDRLLAIAKSDDMAPWALYTDYDRPIARRIVETAGVPRELFGQSKKMVTSTVGVDKSNYITLDDLGLSAEFRERLAAHRRRHDGPVLAASFALNNGIHRLMRGAHWTAHAVRRALSRPRAPVEPAQASAPRTPPKFTLKDRIFFEMEFQLPYRRTFMLPFTDLNFAAQVANEMLASDYRSF